MATRLVDLPPRVAARGVVAGGAAGGQLGVRGLAPGACVALPPTAGDRGRTVFIDPGHGGPDPGASGVGIDEKAATLAVATRLAGLLRADGWRVVLSRTADTSVAALGPGDVDAGEETASAVHRDLLARIACANAARAEVLVSVHFNGFDDASVGGTQTFYDPDRTFGARSRSLARSLQDALVAALGGDDRGVTPDTDLDASALTGAGATYGHLVELGPAQPGWVDAPSAMPGALVEPLFVTDPEEAAVAGSAAGQQRIAQALYAGLRAYLGG